MTQAASPIFPVSENVAQMKPSSTLAAMQAAEAMRAAGVNVVDFGAGEPDFDTPENIKEAADKAMRAGKTKYTPTAGTRNLQQAHGSWSGRRISLHGLDRDYDGV